MSSSRWAWWRLKLRAIVLLLLERRPAAEATFDEMLRHWPDDPYALASLSHLKAQAGRRDEAIADAQRLVQAHPQRSAGDWFNLAFLLETADRLDEAEAAFRRALQLDEKLDRAWYGLGLALIRQQRYDEAVTALKRNTELQPMSPYGWYQLARVHIDRHDPESARKIIRHLQGFEPKVAAQLQRETGLAP
ncbi:tetratricopeptide repeat protein [Piscinibacter sp.]|uniref:tetratricopeptide repeat protein n=1 Tax=Piscinibacter sp. TaxID=1903157 RepID=UPI002CB5324C|nr:tetratricopeptide repeat protein [Albitalea sp.]HUG26388.1 tetratricopeptide repeat protein [Albitalea sp.]